MAKTNTSNPIVRAFRFYVDGFRSLTPMSKALWIIIGLKLIVMFAILRPFFFTNYNKAEAKRKNITPTEQVQNELIDRGITPTTDSLRH